MTRHPGVNMTCTTDITPKSPSPLAPNVGGERKAFVFYYNWYTDVCDNLDRAEQGEFFLTIARYAVTGQLPDDTFSPAIRSMFGLVRATVDNDQKKFSVRCENQQKARLSKMQCAQNERNTSDGKILNIKEQRLNINLEKEEEETQRASVGSVSEPKPRGPIVTREEVEAYWARREFKSDVKEFYDYYDGRRWLNYRGEQIGSWKRAACYWEDKYVHDVLPMRRREERAAASEAAASRHKAEAVEAEQLRRTERAAREAEADRRAARAVSPEQGRRMYQNALLLCNNDHEAALRLLQRAPGDPALFKRLSQ